jgi:HNH endonuclease
MLDQDKVLYLFDYKDGRLYWKNSLRPSFNGKEAGCDNGNGYKKVTIDGKQYYVHRIIYLMHHGFFPLFIDHIDCNPSNNKIDNLRQATASQNTINFIRKRKSKSGVCNVSFDKRRNKFCVYIKINCKSKFLGSFEDLELAELVAQEARSKHYGEFNILEAK